MIHRIVAPLNDIHLKELLRGSGSAFMLKIAGLLLSYLFTLLITRIYGADTMGLFALSITILTILAMLGRLGFDTALVRFVAEYASQDRMDLVREVYVTALRIVIPFCLLLSILLFLSSPVIAENIFHKNHLSPYLRIISLAIIPMAMIFLNSESLRGLRKIKEHAFLHDVSILLFATVMLVLSFLIVLDSHVPLIVYIISITGVAGLSVVWWFKRANISSLANGNNLQSKNLLTVSLPMLLTSSLFLVMWWTDTIMLGIFRTEGEVGIYSVALKIATLASITLFSINTIAAPKFAEFYGRGDMNSLEKIIKQSSKLIFWSSLFIILCIFLFPSFILGLFGAPFKAGIYALLFLSFGQFINAASGSVGWILQMTGRQKACQNITLCAAAMNLVLNALLIPKYGINGAAVATMVCTIFWNLTSVLYIRSHFHITTLYLPGL
jgi:O-antigen/teichoic acid export membrane protein